MRRIICGKEYDTAQAQCVHRFCCGAYGDARGYEETLYRAPQGHLFLYANGGRASLYPTERIRRISKAAARQWLLRHRDASQADSQVFF